MERPQRVFLGSNLGGVGVGAEHQVAGGGGLGRKLGSSRTPAPCRRDGRPRSSGAVSVSLT